MSGSSATNAAKKGVGILLSATKTGFSAVTTGIAKVKKSYDNKHENDVLAALRQKGLNPENHVYQAFRRIYFLYLAGYSHEVVAAAQLTGNRLVDSEKSSVPLDAVIILGHAVCEECLKYGDFAKGKLSQGLQDFLNKSRKGQDHVDRESISHDVYYSVLITVETHGEEWQSIERVFREAASQLVANAICITEEEGDSRTVAAKALYIFISEIRNLAQEAELKKQKALRDAENLLRKEQEKQPRTSFV